MIALKNILVATDFGEAAEAALKYGRALARNFGATLHLLHVGEDVAGRFFVAEGYADLLPDALPELQEKVEEVARRRLRDLVVDNDPQPVPSKPVLITSNAPAPTIVQYAKDHDIDLIVIGTHGRGAIAHLLMGGVAERVVRTASCPVLVVRHPEHEFLVSDALAKAKRA